MTYPTPPGQRRWLRAARGLHRSERARRSSASAAAARRRRGRTHELGVVTELRAGTYIYGDRACMANGSVPLEDCALRVIATVVSRPTRERAILDAGSKTLTSDLAAGADRARPARRVPGRGGLRLNEEHGIVDVSACSEPAARSATVSRRPEPRLHDGEPARRGRPAPRRRDRRDAAHRRARARALASPRGGSRRRCPPPSAARRRAHRSARRRRRGSRPRPAAGYGSQLGEQRADRVEQQVAVRADPAAEHDERRRR